MRFALPRVAASTLVLVAPLTVSSAATSAQTRQATRNYEFAVQALRGGNFGKARTYFDKAVGVFPAFPEAHIGLGHIAMSEQRFDDALREYELARDGYGEFGDTMFDLEVRRFLDAQSEINKLKDEILDLMRQPGNNINPPARIQKDITERESRIRELEAIVPPSQNSSPDPPAEVYFYVGNALFRLGRLDEAMGAWETCARKNGKFPLVFNNLAVAYWRKGQFEKAKESLARAQELGMPVNPGFKADLDRSEHLVADVQQVR